MNELEAIPLRLVRLRALTEAVQDLPPPPLLTEVDSEIAAQRQVGCDGGGGRCPSDDQKDQW